MPLPSGESSSRSKALFAPKLTLRLSHPLAASLAISSIWAISPTSKTPGYVDASDVPSVLLGLEPNPKSSSPVTKTLNQIDYLLNGSVPTSIPFIDSTSGIVASSKESMERVIELIFLDSSIERRGFHLLYKLGEMIIVKLSSFHRWHDYHHQELLLFILLIEKIKVKRILY